MKIQCCTQLKHWGLWGPWLEAPGIMGSVAGSTGDYGVRGLTAPSLILAISIEKLQTIMFVMLC